MPGVEHLPIQWPRPSWITSAQGRMRPVLIVDHIMQGYLGTMLDWTRTGGSKVIAHFGVARDGRTVQFQDVLTPGIHASSLNRPVARRALERSSIAGGVNTYSIGIEHEGCSIDPRPAYSVPPELIYSEQNPWPEPMVRSSLAIKRWCFATVPTLEGPSRDSIVGHYEVDATNRSNDPATPVDRTRGVWPVERFIRELRGDGQVPKENRKAREVVMATTYKVKRNDTLGAISTKSGVSVADLVLWNRILDPNVIEVGQVLRLTPPDEVEPASSPEAYAAGWESGWTAGYAAAVASLETRLRLIEQQVDAAQIEASTLASTPPPAPTPPDK
jgi:LysM repeat protein